MLGTIASFGLAALLIAPHQVAPFYLADALIVATGAAVTAFCIPDRPAQPAARPVVRSWRALWLEPWRHPDINWVFATRSMMMLALYTLFTFVAYYVQDVIHISQFAQGAAAIAGIAVVAALVGGVLTGWLSDRMGRKPLVSAASALMAGALLALAFVHQLGVVLGLGVVFGLALGTYMAVDWALAVDVLPDEGFAAKDLGLWGISTNLPQTLAPLVAALCAGLSGMLILRVRGVR
jgi:MFS family permease